MYTGFDNYTGLCYASAEKKKEFRYKNVFGIETNDTHAKFKKKQTNKQTNKQTKNKQKMKSVK